MNTPGRKIMIIEDDLPLLHSLAFTLKRHGYPVSLASNGLEALDRLIVAQLSADPYRLLITDIQLPGLTGLELIDRLREREILLPTLVITAYYGSDLVLQLGKRGIRELLPKPFGSDELVRRVSKLLDNGLTYEKEIHP
jgi:DNA-binding response OmpR family regulator